MSSTGINIPALLSLAASTSPPFTFNSSQTDNSLSPGMGPWTPPQFAQPALTILTVQSTSNQSTGQPATPQVNYVFDAVFNIKHNRRIQKTSHPVLTGANISDHFYVLPARVTLEIGMSDAMASFASGIWVGASTKSISAWQIMKGFQINGTLLTLTTRLDTYQNMLIVDADSPDDNKTKHGLRATFVLEELLSASVLSIASQSARPQTSGENSNGVVQSTGADPSQVQQHQIPSPLYPDVSTYPQVPGAGDVSSNSLSLATP